MDLISWNKVFRPCRICFDNQNVNAVTHRKSPKHQTGVTKKLEEMSIEIRQLNIGNVVVHDSEWPQKDDMLTCCFCRDSCYAKNASTDSSYFRKHATRNEFVIEYLGLLYHLSEPQHVEAVKVFLKFHQREETFESFCQSITEVERFLSNIPKAEQKYLKIMDVLHEMSVKDIQANDRKRKEFVATLELPEIEDDEPSYERYIFTSSVDNRGGVIKEGHSNIQGKDFATEEESLVPPWLRGECSNMSEQITPKTVIGPTMDTLQKHVEKQKKKGLPVKRLMKKVLKPSDKKPKSQMPSFGGVWSKGRQRSSKGQF